MRASITGVGGRFSRSTTPQGGQEDGDQLKDGDCRHGAGRDGAGHRAKHGTAQPTPIRGQPKRRTQVRGRIQELVLKPFTIFCEAAKSTKSGISPTFPSKTLTAVVKYSGCEAEATLNKAEYELKAKFLSPVTFNYHANGYVEVGAGGTVKEGKLEGAHEIEISVKGPFKCTIDIPAGTYPVNQINKPEGDYEAVKYTNKEETVEKGKAPVIVKKLEITSALTKMPYELEGEFCEALPKTEYTNGTYNGSLLAELKKGSIGWE